MKKTMVVFLSIVLASVSLFGCATNNNTVVMATNAKFEPFEYVTDKGLVGNLDGIDIAISLEIAKELKKELKIEDMEFTSILNSISTGKADFAAAGMTADDERRKNVDFSDTYYVATQYMIAKEGTTIKSSKDILDKRVGVVDGYTGQSVCEKLGVKNLLGFKQGTDAVMELVNNKLDCVVIDSHTALALVAKNKGLVILKDEEAFETEEYAIAVKKGNKDMLNTINTVLKRMKESGEIEKLVVHYTDATEMK